MSRTSLPLFTGNHLELVPDPATGWEYVQRPNVSGIVVIVATTDQNDVILVEQHRPPVGAKVLELPAGLAGDTAAYAGETLITAARRELLEETGFVSDDWMVVYATTPSAGITSEIHTYVRALTCRRSGPGGGDESEDITTSLVPAADIMDFIRNYAEQPGCLVSSTVLAGVALLQQGA